MSFVLLHADRDATVVAEDPIVPAADVTRVRDAAMLLQAARDAREQAMAAAEALRVAAREAGYRAGLAEGRAVGSEQAQAELLRLAARDRETQERRREEVARLGLEVVRRIADGIGEGAMVAGLAERAVAELVPDERVTVRVPPAALAPTVERLGDRPGLTVEADDSLDENDCVVETALGSAHAGLATQLALIERTWGLA